MKSDHQVLVKTRGKGEGKVACKEVGRGCEEEDEEEEESLCIANAVNEEDSERERATLV